MILENLKRDARRADVLLSERPTALRYAFAAIAVMAALGGRWALEPILGLYSPYLLFALAVIVAGRYGGRGPGFIATALSTVSVWHFFIAPIDSLRLGDPRAAASLALFVLVGVCLSVLVGQLRESLLS